MNQYKKIFNFFYDIRREYKKNENEVSIKSE